MPKFIVGGYMGYVGTEWREVLEFDSQEDAEEYAKDYVLERVEWWAEECKTSKSTDQDED